MHRISNSIHEVAHLNSKRNLRSFQVAWNLLVGVPTMMPSFFFEHHMAHHRTNCYGTEHDGEYLPLGRGPLMNIVMFLTQVILQPIFVIVRFTIFTPISFLHPKLRKWTLEHFSSFVFDFPYKRTLAKNAPLKWWAAMDVMCCLRAWAIFVLAWIGVSPAYQVPKLFLLALLPLSMHYFRSLTAHNWLSDGGKSSFRDQLFDSIDIKGNYLTELFYPVGLRYHAMHHLFPTMPYHNLGIAHRRLMAQLPADAPYRKLVYPSVWSVLKELFANARRIPKEAASSKTVSESA